MFYVCRVKNDNHMENDKPKPGRKKIIDGVKKQIICTQKEFELISNLLKEIRKTKKDV